MPSWGTTHTTNIPANSTANANNTTDKAKKKKKDNTSVNTVGMVEIKPSIQSGEQTGEHWTNEQMCQTDNT